MAATSINNYLVKNLKTIKRKDLDYETDEIEVKDIDNLFDDIKISIWKFKKLAGEHKLQFPSGVKINEKFGNFYYTPYFFYETASQRKGYQDFVDLVIYISKSKKIN